MYHNHQPANQPTSQLHTAHSSNNGVVFALAASPPVTDGGGERKMGGA